MTIGTKEHEQIHRTRWGDDDGGRITGEKEERKKEKVEGMRWVVCDGG